MPGGKFFNNFSKFVGQIWENRLNWLPVLAIILVGLLITQSLSGIGIDFSAAGIDFLAEGETSQEAGGAEEVDLSEVSHRDTELEKLIYERQSVRNYQDEEVSLDKVARILWSAVGITVDGVTGPTRAAPSAGATDPLVVYLAASNVENLEEGIYRYHPEDHRLSLSAAGDKTVELAQAGLGQAAIQEAPFSLIITADFARTTRRYGERGERYVKIEAGHAAQNANLMAENLDLSGVMIGAFRDEQVQQVMGDIPEDPLLIIPLGRRN